jgi:hypothetical protein
MVQSNSTAALEKLEKVLSSSYVSKFRKMTEGVFLYLVGLFANFSVYITPIFECTFSHFHVPNMKIITVA